MVVGAHERLYAAAGAELRQFDVHAVELAHGHQRLRACKAAGVAVAQQFEREAEGVCAYLFAWRERVAVDGVQPREECPHHLAFAAEVRGADAVLEAVVEAGISAAGGIVGVQFQIGRVVVREERGERGGARKGRGRGEPQEKEQGTQAGGHRRRVLVGWRGNRSLTHRGVSRRPWRAPARARVRVALVPRFT